MNTTAQGAKAIVLGTTASTETEKQLFEVDRSVLTENFQTSDGVIKIFCKKCGRYYETHQAGLDTFAKDNGFETPDPSGFYLESDGCRCGLGDISTKLVEIPKE